MAIIDGTPNGDTLAGTSGDDTINGLDGNDTIDPGLGKDTVSGGDGDDTIRLTDPGHIVFTGSGFEFDSYDGGAGHDTIEFHPWLSTPNVEYPYGPQSGYGLAVVSGVERLVLASTESVDILVTTGTTQIATGITEVVGGSGRDTLTINVAGASGAFSMPSLALSNWTSAAYPDLAGGDIVILQATPNGNFTLNALDGLASAQGLFSGGGNDTLNGSSGVDMLNGNGGTNVLNGNGGNDVLAIVNSKDSLGTTSTFTGAGSTFDGGSGTDALSIGGAVNFQGTLTSIERIHLQAAWASPLTNGSMSQEAASLTISAATMSALPTTLALAGNGTITVNLAPGDSYDATSFAVAGGSSISHLVNGSGAGDLIRGLQTADTLKGNDGNDVLEGNAGNDTMYGGAGADTMNGGAGNDSLVGGAGADILVGSAGDDLIYVDSAADVVIEAAGEGNSDRVLASVSYALGAGVQVERLTTDNTAGVAAINLTGNEIGNVIYGNAGANVLDGGGGVDQLIGLGGNDWYYVDDVLDEVDDLAGQGTADRIFASVSYALYTDDNIEKLTTSNNAGTAAINLTGNSFANQIYGNAGNNVLDGKGGADALVGFAGDDTFYVDNAADTVTEYAGQGADRVLASVSYKLGSGMHVELLTTTNDAATTAINLTGNELANTLRGNAGANVLDGKGGADSMNGLAGDDWYYVDNAGDTITEGAGGGAGDRVLASLSFTLAAGVHVERLTTSHNAGTAAIDLTGNEIGNVIYGNAGANVLDGKGGNDVLLGLDGQDSFAFTTALGAGNVDRIDDFVVADDTIRLDNAVFGGLADGALAAGAFATGPAATEADDRIVYDSATGALLFDADGSGAGAAVQFATLAGGLALTSGDFLVI
jgi:serralysin